MMKWIGLCGKLIGIVIIKNVKNLLYIRGILYSIKRSNYIKKIWMR